MAEKISDSEMLELQQTVIPHVKRDSQRTLLLTSNESIKQKTESRLSDAGYKVVERESAGTGERAYVIKDS
jgi:hypothetical protein